MTRIRRGVRAIGRALLAVVAIYAAAGLLGGSVPVNGDWRPPATGGIPVTVESNGVHVGLVVPKVAAGVDWRRLFPARDLADPRHGGWEHLAIGWGEEGFYLRTPTWWDVRPGTIAAAAIGSQRTLLHVEHVPPPRPDARTRTVMLRPGEYRRLAAFIASTVAHDHPARRGYGAADVFYPARGRYDAVRTCNAWTGAALAHAGVRVGWWTPFPVTVTWWF